MRRLSMTCCPRYDVELIRCYPGYDVILIRHQQGKDIVSLHCNLRRHGKFSLVGRTRPAV